MNGARCHVRGRCRLWHAAAATAAVVCCAPSTKQLHCALPLYVQHGMTPTTLLQLLCAALLAGVAAGYASGICQDQCGSKRQFSDPNNLPGEVCQDNGPCGALVFPGR